jgi:preprotein translocase subunit SecB
MSNGEPTFQIEKLYVKDLSLELPNAPQVFLQAEQPQLEVQIANEASRISEGIFEVTVGVTVTARAGERTVFLIEAVQEEMGPLLGIGCPTIIYPYARETISDIVTRAGFPPVLLAPVSFEAIYAQRSQEGGGDSRIEVAS